MGLSLALLLAQAGLCLPLPPQKAAAAEAAADPAPTVASPAPIQRFVYRQALLNFGFELEIYAADPGKAQTLAQEIWKKLQNTARAFTPAAQAKLEAEANLKPAPIAPAVVELLKELMRYHGLSEGAIDPTAGALYQLWGFVPGALSLHVPAAALLKKALAKQNQAALELQNTPDRLYFKQSGLQLYLQQGLQGLLVDQGAHLIRQSGLVAALSTPEVGYYQGAPPDAQAWKVPVPHPEEEGKLFSYLYVKDQALAQISVHGQVFTNRGLNYHSLLDARTGLPTEQGLSISLTQPSALQAELSAHLLIRLDDNICKKRITELPQTRALKLVRRNGLLLPLEYAH
jgi:thiamine biosynthesis lipoprotein